MGNSPFPILKKSVCFDKIKKSGPDRPQKGGVRMEDDGVGFDVSKLDLSGEAAAAGDHNHIALPNVIRRLHLLYGEQADLKITSEPGRGTSVLLILPIDQTKG